MADRTLNVVGPTESGLLLEDADTGATVEMNAIYPPNFGFTPMKHYLCHPGYLSPGGVGRRDQTKADGWEETFIFHGPDDSIAETGRSTTGIKRVLWKNGVAVACFGAWLYDDESPDLEGARESMYEDVRAVSIGD